MEGAVFFTIIAVFVLTIVLISAHFAKKRREAWQKAASELRFQYRESDAVHAQFGYFKIFTYGRSANSYNIIFGKTEEDEVRIFDYTYTTGSGKHRRTHNQTLCIISSKILRLPHFFIRKESTLFDFFGKMFGGQDINYDEDPKFSKAFVLQGENEFATRELFNAKVRRTFLNFENTDMQIEGRDNTILFNSGSSIEPDKAKSLLAKALAVKKVFMPPEGS